MSETYACGQLFNIGFSIASEKPYFKLKVLYQTCSPVSSNCFQSLLHCSVKKGKRSKIQLKKYTNIEMNLKIIGLN